MTDVARAHGGHCGGGDRPPGDGGDWQPPSGCQGSDGARRERGRNRNKGLKATLTKTKVSTLPVDFEKDRYDTYVAVGTNGDNFNLLVGTIVSKIPPYYHEWRSVPANFKATIISEIESYFDLTPHFEGVDGENVEKGILQYCASRYRDQKFKFRDQWYESKGGLPCADTLWNDPPPEMSEEDRHKFMTYVTSEKFLKRSAANKRCRAKQKITVHQGRKSLAQNRYDHRDPVTQEPASLISEYAHLRQKGGKFSQQEAADKYAKMIELKEAQAGVENPMTEDEIVTSVLGPCRSSQRGIGQKIPQSSLRTTSSSASQSSQRMYT